MVNLPDKEDLPTIADKFLAKYQLPNCIGALDGSFIHILQPAQDDRACYCYKKFYAVSMLAVVDTDGRIIHFNAGARGAVGDASMWNHSDFHRKLHRWDRYDVQPVFISPAGNFVSPLNRAATAVNSYVIADAAFALTPRLTRQLVKIMWGRLSGRWHVIKNNNINDNGFATCTAKAAAALHNICEEQRAWYQQGWEVDADADRHAVAAARSAARRAAAALRTCARLPTNLSDLASVAVRRQAEAVRQAPTCLLV